MRKLVLLPLLAAALSAAETTYPLESVTIEGSRVSRDIVLELSGLRMGAPTNKETIEQACKKLEDTGVFSSIQYSYAPGPHNGFAVTLSLVDQSGLVAATLDLPGVDDAETWRWIESRFPAFDHKIPGADAAQQYMAKSIEQHCLDKLHGQHVVARQESDAGRSMVSFQPEVLPRVAEMTFNGQHEFTSDELSRILQKVVSGSEGYMARTFRQFVELNLRPAYENHGMYRVKFPSISMKELDANSVAVATTVEEGPKYSLGDVQLTGDNLPVDEMMSVAAFPKGKLANWMEINNGVQKSEAPVRRAGYLQVSSSPERIFDDANHVLGLKVVYRKGPLFHFGNVIFTGFPPDLEAKARKMWQLQPGQPYDNTYPGTFLNTLIRTPDFRNGRRYGSKAQAGTGEHVMDVVITSESKQTP